MTPTDGDAPRLWITRTEPGATRMARQLAQLGLRSWVAPVLCIQPLPAAPAQPARVAIVLSEHAVECLSAGDRQCLHASTDVLAIGSTTAAALRAAGIEARIPEQATSEGLLRLLDSQTLQGVDVCIYKGEGGRGVLPEGLRARGARVFLRDLYRRDTLNTLDPPEDIHDIGAILAASGDGLRALTPWWQRWGGVMHTPLLASSDRVAHMARGIGFVNAYNCAGADSQAVASVLQRLDPAAT